MEECEKILRNNRLMTQREIKEEHFENIEEKDLHSDRRPISKTFSYLYDS
jgi:hypothetical protein